MTRLIEEITIGETTLTVRELTVGEVREWFKKMANPTEADVVGDMLFGNYALNDLTVMSSVEVGQLDKFSVSEIEKLAEACKKLNASFFQFRAKLEDIGRSLTQKKT